MSDESNRGFVKFEVRQGNDFHMLGEIQLEFQRGGNQNIY
jgi:hypothetical protein